MQTCAALEILLSASRYSPEQWKPVGSWNGMINVSKHIPVDYKILALIRSTCEAVSPVCVRACVRVHVHRGHIFEVILFFFFSFFLLCHVFFFTNIPNQGETHIFSCSFWRFEVRDSLCFVPELGWTWGCLLPQIHIHHSPIKFRAKDWTQILILWLNKFPTGICFSPSELCNELCEPKKILFILFKNSARDKIN